MRLGFILGFLFGGGVASLMARVKEKEPSPAATDEPERSVRGTAGPVVERVKHQLDEAREAAREAQMEKEAEMRRMLDDMVHRKGEASGDEGEREA